MLTITSQPKPESYVLREYPFRVPQEIRFYLYSPADIAALLNAFARPGLTRTMPAECLHLLVGLLHATGPRIKNCCIHVTHRCHTREFLFGC